jgi:hypothetical protein
VISSVVGVTKKGLFGAFAERAPDRRSESAA